MSRATGVLHNHASFANGAAYADLNNDGYLDLIVNNINDEAFIYKNNSPHHSNYLELKLVGDSLNRNGLGAWIEIYYDGKQQVYEETPYRGYLSTMQMDAHFGLGQNRPGGGGGGGSIQSGGQNGRMGKMQIFFECSGQSKK